MNYLSKTPVKSMIWLATLLFLSLSASMAFSAGDYVWEAKFKEELPKAEKGDAKAQYAIGEMYEKGKGAVRDDKEAFKWYAKAAAKGGKRAAYKLGLFYYEGTGVSKDYDKARTWFTKSANKNYARAEYYLGEIYENGHGVKRDNNTALKWYKRALAGGYGNAEDGIKRIGRKNSIPRKKTKQARPSIATGNSASKTIDTILKGGWKKRKRPVDYLPSSVTNCKRTGKNLECNSKLSTRNIGMAEISYTTKAIIFGFHGKNQFKISYRNNVETIKVTDEEFAESGGKVPVKLGWQDAEHKLACQVENSKTITCTKNKTRTITLKR